MKIFTLICSLLLIGLGATDYYGWGVDGDGPQTLISAIPAGFGALMLAGLVLSFLLRRTGTQIAILAALAGGFSGLGRLTPSYLKETLEWQARPLILIVAMATISLVYLVVALVHAIVPKRSGMARSSPTEGNAEEEPESIPC